jgi:hypothetical protein
VEFLQLEQAAETKDGGIIEGRALDEKVLSGVQRSTYDLCTVLALMDPY